MKTIKLRLDNVLARQTEDMCAILGLTLAEFCQLCVIQKTTEIREELANATASLREVEAKEISQ